MDEDILPKVKWNKGATLKNPRPQPRRIPDRTIMGEAIREYSQRGGTTVDAFEQIGSRLKKLWEIDTLFMIKEGDDLNTPEGLAKLAEKYQNTPIGSKPSETTFKQDADGNLIGIPEEYDRVPPRVRVFQRVHNTHTLDGHKFHEFYHFVLDNIKRVRRTSMYFSGNIYFILEENFVRNEAKYSAKFTNRELLMGLYQRGMINWHRTEKLSDI